MGTDAHLEENEHSVLIASTERTHVRLSRNQAHPGYCVVVPDLPGAGCTSHERLAGQSRLGRPLILIG